MGLDAHGTNEPQTGLGVREDAHDTGSSLDLLIESLEHVRALQMLVVRPWQAVEAERLADIPLDPIDELRIFALPLGDPGRQIPVGLLQVAPVVDPAQFLQTVVVRLPGQVVEGIPEECT